MPEYTDYKLSLTNEEIDAALRLVNKMEISTAKITVPANTKGTYNYTVHFGYGHSNPRIFLQLSMKSTAASAFLNVQPIVTNVHDTYFDITLVATNTSEYSDVKQISPGTYYVDYLVVGL